MIEYAHKDYLSTITINRPEKANALTPEILSALIDAVEKAHGSRAVILTGVGRVFSAGADLGFIESGLAVSSAWETLSQRIADLPGLTVCALNGTLAGDAFGMALACDIRIAVPDARFFYPALKKRVIPPPSDPMRMRKLIGPSRTKMLLLAGQEIDSAIAQRWGLIDNTTAPNSLMSHAHALVANTRNTPLSQLRCIKEAIDA